MGRSEGWKGREKPRSFIWDGVIYAPLRPGQPAKHLLRVRPETSGRIAEFSEHEAD